MDNETEKTYKDEIRESIQEFIAKVIGWFSFNKGDSVLLYLINLVWKIPAFLIMLCLSPILLVILFFTFVVVA